MEHKVESKRQRLADDVIVCHEAPADVICDDVIEPVVAAARVEQEQIGDAQDCQVETRRQDFVAEATEHDQ